MASTEEIVLDGEALNTILDNLSKKSARDRCTIRLSFLPFEPQGKVDNMLKDVVGPKRHVEISFEVTGPIGAVSFSAWSGHFPDLPDNAGWGAKAWRYIESWIRNPPIMRGTWVAPRTFSNDAYTHIAFNVTGEQEADLFRACARLHGAGFNSSGYYRSVMWTPLRRDTTRDCFFCSEAVLTALQDSGILPSILNEENLWVADTNPGGMTPSRLFEALAPFGEVVMNQIHSIDTSVGRGVAATYFPGSGDADSEW